MISNDSVVSLRYALHVDGVAVEDGELDYLHGHGNIVPGLEAGLEGAIVGEQRDVEVPPELGYGPRMDAATQRVPREAFPPEAPLRVGLRFAVRGPDGQPVPAFVADLDDTSVLVDLNHPMAGKTLHFSVTVVAVRAATDEERTHGHAHGPDGHGHHH